MTLFHRANALCTSTAHNFSDAMGRNEFLDLMHCLRCENTFPLSIETKQSYCLVFHKPQGKLT